MAVDALERVRRWVRDSESESKAAAKASAREQLADVAGKPVDLAEAEDKLRGAEQQEEKARRRVAREQAKSRQAEQEVAILRGETPTGEEENGEER